MSSVALHDAMETQVPPLQLVEQHWDPSVQASPSVEHVVLPAGGATHFEPEPQSPEQHCESLAQGWSTWRQTVDEHVAPGLPALGQLREQHWASEPQGSPGYAHIPASATQNPFEPHTAEQHCESAEQCVVVSSMQDGVGGVSHAREALQ